MKNILLTGVGGQGTVLASRLIQESYLKKGQYIKSTETIGMAQMGGSVNSHIRIGENIYSPFIPEGEADLVLAFEPMEGARNIKYCNENTVVITSKTPIKPITDGLSQDDYKVEDMIEFLGENTVLYTVDFQPLFDEIGTKKPLNIAIIGYAIGLGVLDIKKELEDVLRSTMRKDLLELNMKALNYGIKEGKKCEG